jgi:hypothetical protein
MIDVMHDAEKDTLNINAEGDALNVFVTFSFMVAVVSSSRVISAALMHLFCAVLQLGSASQKRSAELRDMALEASSQGRQLQRKVRFTVVFVFVFAFITVIVRGGVSLAYSVCQALQDNYNPCSSSNCDSCRNVHSNMQGWGSVDTEYAVPLAPTRASLHAAHMISLQIDRRVRSLSFALLAALCGMPEVQVIEAMSAGQNRSHPAANASSATQRI